MDALLSGTYQPFVIAGLVMAGLVLIETVALVAGFSLNHLIDQSLDPEAFDGSGSQMDAAGFAGGLMGWINAGSVPLLVLIIAWLASFSAAGFALQTLATYLVAALPLPAAGLAAFCVAAPATRFTTRLISRLVPREETYAVFDDDLVGRVAEVTLGPIDQGPAGRIKVRDPHGNWHFPMAKIAEGHEPAPVGSHVLIVDRIGPVFKVIPAPDELKTTS